MKFKLSTKLLTILSLYILSTSTILYFVLIRTVTTGAMEKIEEEINSNFVNLVKMIKKDKLFENPKNMSKKIHMLENNQNFLKKILVLQNKTIIFSSNIDELNENVNILKLDMNVIYNSKDGYKDKDDNCIYFSANLLEEQKIKILAIYSTAIVKHATKHFEESFPLYMLLITIIFFILMLITIKILVLNPIERLSSTTQDIINGNLSKRVSINTGDEFETVGKIFNLMAQNLENKIEEKITLLRILSHDLTNQIGSGSSLIETLIQSINFIEKDEIEEYLGYIRKDLKNSQKLIDFTRKFMAIESGKLNLELKNEDIVEVLKESILSFKAKTDKKNIEIVFKSKDRVCLNIDLVVFKYSIINNLLSNAIKFSLPNNRVIVEIIDSKDEIIILFENIGEYIPTEKISKLFSLADKTTSPGTAGERGTGFGLPIVYKFLELMGGDIEVESINEDKNRAINRFTIIFKVQNENINC